MASIIRIKRSSGILAPTTLKTAELAYAYGNGTYQNQGDRLFVGKGDDGTGQATSIVTIGGSYFTDMLDHNPGLLRTNSAIIVDSDKKIEELKSGNIHIDGFNDKITGLVAPTDSSGATTKRYVDSAISAAVYDSTGVVGGTYGGATSIPIITVDNFGRIDSVGTSPLSTTLNISADSGTADSVDLINDTLNFSGSTGIITKVVDSGIDIRLDSTGVQPGVQFGGGSSLPRITVDAFGRATHIDQTNILAELTIKDDITANSPTEHKLFTTQNDLVIKGGGGITVTMSGPTHSQQGVADYTDGVFEISVDSGGAVSADSGNFNALYLGTDSGRDWAWGLPGGENYYQRSPTLHQAGDAVLGLSYDGSNYGNVQLFDSSGGNLIMGPVTPSVNPVYGEPFGFVMGHWQARNPNYNLGTIARPWRGTALDHNLDFVSENSMIRIRNERDSSFQITTRTNAVSYPTTYTMVNYNTLDSQIEYYIDQRLKIDKYIYFGDSPSHGYIGKESTDQWLNIGNGGTGIALYSSNIKLASTSNAGFKVIEVQGSVKPNYVPGEVFDIGDSLGLVPATHYRTFKDAYFSGTLYADSFERTGVSLDSGVYGSASAIPVFTVNRSGLIDSIGSVPVAGVDSASWGSSSLHHRPASAVVGDNLLTITTGDGTAHEVEISQFADSVQFGNNVRFSHQPNHKVIIPHNTTLSFQDHSHMGIFGGDATTMFRSSGNSGEFEVYNNGNIKINSSGNKGVYFPGKVEFENSVVFDDSATFTKVSVDNITIDGNTISSTDNSNQLFIDPFPVGDSGDLVVRGNLIVQGTETVVNSTVVSLNDKNLVLADSAATAAVADGAGLTVGGDQFDSTATKPQFVFDAATYRWDPNLPIDIPFVSLDSAVFLNGVALREVIEDHLDNFFGVDSNNAVTITYDDVANTMTWKGTDASTTQKGVSSFDSSNFTITAGHVAVTVLDGGTW